MGMLGYFDRFKRSLGTQIATGQANYLGSWGLPEEWRDTTPSGDYLRLSPAVYMATRYRSQKLASVPLTFQKVGRDGKKTKVETGSLVELMSKVNPFWTASRLYEMTEMSLLLRGKSFWALDRGQGRAAREPKEIWWLHPDQVKVVKGGSYVRHFEYDPGYGSIIQFGLDEILWLRYPNPNDQYDGLAPLDAARIIADTGSAALQSNRKMFAQGMQLAGFVSPASDSDSWTQEQGDLIEKSLTRRFSGSKNAHRWAVLGRNMKFSPLSLSPKDIEFIALLKWSFEDICRVFGMSPDLLGGERTYANAAEARLAFWQDTMIPECRFVADEITEQLLPMFPGQADIAEFDLSDVGALKENEDSLHMRARENYRAGLLTYDQAREKIGEDPLPNGQGDVLIVPATVQLVKPSELLKLTEPAPEPPPDPAPAEQAPPASGSKSLTTGNTRVMAFGGTEHERVWRAFTERSDRHEAKVKSTVTRLFKDQQKSIIAKMTGRSVREVNPDNPFDKPQWIRKFRESMRPVIQQIVDDAGTAALADISVGIGFDVKSPDAMRFLEQRTQRFALQVNETTWDSLRTSLVEGMDAGESIDDLAKRVEAVMGDRISSNAQTIARTETIGALNGGSQIAWEQSGVVAGKEWVAALDERTRDTHIAAHGQRVKLNDDFSVGGGSGPQPGQIGIAEEDINCRCSAVPILDTEWEG